MTHLEFDGITSWRLTEEEVRRVLENESMEHATDARQVSIFCVFFL